MRRYVSDEHARRRRGDRRYVVVLCVPHTAVAERFRPLRERDASGVSIAGGFSRRDEGEVEDRKDER